MFIPEDDDTRNDDGFMMNFTRVPEGFDQKQWPFSVMQKYCIIPGCCGKSDNNMFCLFHGSNKAHRCSERGCKFLVNANNKCFFHNNIDSVSEAQIALLTTLLKVDGACGCFEDNSFCFKGIIEGTNVCHTHWRNSNPTHKQKVNVLLQSLRIHKPLALCSGCNGLMLCDIGSKCFRCDNNKDFLSDQIKFNTKIENWTYNNKTHFFHKDLF